MAHNQLPYLSFGVSLQINITAGESPSPTQRPLHDYYSGLFWLSAQLIKASVKHCSSMQLPAITEKSRKKRRCLLEMFNYNTFMMFKYSIQNVFDTAWGILFLLCFTTKITIPPLHHSFNEVSSLQPDTIHENTQWNKGKFVGHQSIFLSKQLQHCFSIHAKNGKNGHALQFSEYGPASFSFLFNVKT